MRLREIVVDSLDPPALARFWQAALTDFSIRAYDDAEMARLANLGFSPDTDPNVALDGPTLTIFFQRTKQVKDRRNRIHFDLEGGSEDEISRLCQLGAEVRDRHERYVVLLDPEGNEFCVQNRGNQNDE